MVVGPGVNLSTEKILLNPACGCHCGKYFLSDPAKILIPNEYFFSFPNNMTIPYTVPWLTAAHVSNKDVRS